MITFKQTDRINMMEILEYYPSLINDKKLRAYLGMKKLWN
jgi:hypothetical protein